MKRSAKQQRRKGNKASKKHDSVLDLRPAFKGQVVCAIKVECTPQMFTTTVTTGLIRLQFPVSTAEVDTFAARFGATWEEYRIVKAKFRTQLFSSTNPGLLITWVDEKLVGNPTLAESTHKTNEKDSFNASSVDRIHELVWTPHDPLDQQYTAIGTATTFADFKIYSDNANYGSSAVATPYGQVYCTLTFQFRGML